MGEVYHAIDTRLRRPVAIKVLARRIDLVSGGNGASPARGRTASILHHPNICTIYDVGTTPPLFIAMELLEGESLQQRLHRGPLDVASVLDIAIATADGLAAAHAHGFVHRDVKPGNIFLTSHGPKLLDFGLAKTQLPTPGGLSVDDTRPADALLTDSGATVGTTAYMSPEQLRGKDVDARTDVFSLGLVLYEMLTGRPAFSGRTSAEVSGATLYEQPVPPIDLAPHMSPRLNDIVLKALEKDARSAIRPPPTFVPTSDVCAASSTHKRLTPSARRAAAIPHRLRRLPDSTRERRSAASSQRGVSRSHSPSSLRCRPGYGFVFTITRATRDSRPIASLRRRPSGRSTGWNRRWRTRRRRPGR